MFHAPLEITERSLKVYSNNSRFDTFLVIIIAIFCLENKYKVRDNFVLKTPVECHTES